MTGIRIIANLIEHDLSFGSIFILKYASENGHVQADTNNVVNELLLLLCEAYNYTCRPTPMRMRVDVFVLKARGIK